MDNETTAIVTRPGINLHNPFKVCPMTKLAGVWRKRYRTAYFGLVTFSRGGLVLSGAKTILLDAGEDGRLNTQSSPR